MTDRDLTLDKVLPLASRLPPDDQARLIARLAPALERLLDWKGTTSEHAEPPRLRGLLADLGPAPSAEEIDEVQREMWASVSDPSL